MPTYNVWAYVRDIKDDPRPLHERMEEGLRLTNEKIKEVPHVVRILRHPKSSSVTVTTLADAKQDFRNIGLGFIELEPTRTFLIQPSSGSASTARAAIRDAAISLRGICTPYRDIFLFPEQGEPISQLFTLQMEFDKRNIPVTLGIYNAKIPI